jgi:hypothetical protein
VKGFKIGDYIVIVMVVGLILLLFTLTYGFNGSERYIEITGADTSNIFDPVVNRVVDVEGPIGTTRVVIENGKAWVEDSPCRDKICIKMGILSRPGEEAVCLPNRVIVQMKGDRGGVDGVSR